MKGSGLVSAQRQMPRTKTAPWTSQAIKAIKALQRDSGRVISKKDFQRLLVEAVPNVKPGLRFNSHAVAALHEAYERYAVALTH